MLSGTLIALAGSIALVAAFPTIEKRDLAHAPFINITFTGGDPSASYLVKVPVNGTWIPTNNWQLVVSTLTCDYNLGAHCKLRTLNDGPYVLTEEGTATTGIRTFDVGPPSQIGAIECLAGGDPSAAGTA